MRGMVRDDIEVRVDATDHAHHGIYQEKSCAEECSEPESHLIAIEVFKH
jgi:hypothetical protein